MNGNSRARVATHHCGMICCCIALLWVALRCCAALLCCAIPCFAILLCFALPGGTRFDLLCFALSGGTRFDLLCFALLFVASLSFALLCFALPFVLLCFVLLLLLCFALRCLWEPGVGNRGNLPGRGPLPGPLTHKVRTLLGNA